MRTKHRIAKTLEEVNSIIKYCNKTGYASVDFETKATGPHGPVVGKDDKTPTGPQYTEDEPTGLGISFQPGSSWFIPLFHFESPFSRTEALSILKLFGKKVMANPNIVKIAWNFKFEFRWFLRYGCTPRGILLDGMLGKYLLDEERPHGLKEFVDQYIQEFSGYEDDFEEIKKKHGDRWDTVPLKALAKYCCIDTDVTFRATIYLEGLLMKNNFYMLFRNMCMMQVRVLSESESMGMRVDRDYLEALISRQKREIELNEEKLLNHKIIRRYQSWRTKDKIQSLIDTTNRDIAQLKKEAAKTGKDVSKQIRNREEKISRYITGQLVTKKEKVKEVNFNSPPQMVELLFTSPAGFKFKIFKYTKDDRKQDTDRPSTDEESLTELSKKDKSGFIEKLLKHREMSKLFSTYMVAPHYRLTSNSTLHSSYLIHGTVTGRLSSKSPNLQNIPRSTTSSTIKKMFIPPKNHVLLEVDYGQAELRAVAEVALCKALIEIFKKGYNVHLATGLKMSKQLDRYDEIKNLLKDPNHPDLEKWEKVKKKGKVLNFSILYGQSDDMTAGQIGCSVKEAVKVKDEWFKAFPEIRQWMDEQERYVRKNGYVYNLWGRKRRLPGIYDSNKGTQNAAIREAINAPIQGASSDFTQFATIILREKIKKGELKLTDDTYWNKQAYTVHDSIGFYVMPKYLKHCIPIIEEVCSNPQTKEYFGFEMKHVKMKVSPEIGRTWGDLFDYNPEEDYEKYINLT